MGRLQTVISSLTAGQSITIFAAATSVRWKLLWACVGTKNATATCSVSLYEQGSATTLVFGWINATQTGPFQMSPGKAGGWVAATAGSRLALNCADGGPAYGIFIGESF